jgi:transglutaminase-like putative cysteine protease
MDFCAWMEVFLGGRWWTFDPHNGAPRVGRVLTKVGMQHRRSALESRAQIVATKRRITACRGGTNIKP